MFSIWIGSTTRCSIIIFFGHLFLVVNFFLTTKHYINNEAIVLEVFFIFFDGFLFFLKISKIVNLCLTSPSITILHLHSHPRNMNHLTFRLIKLYFEMFSNWEI